jgi:quercetin dioxygenase-like cupin family protein
MRFTSKQRLIGSIAVVAVAVSITFAAVATASPPSGGAAFVPIGVGELVSTAGMGLNVRPGTNNIVGEYTFPAGSSTGWHSHPGKTLVMVQQGTFTVYHDNCHPHVYEAGDAFVELPSSVHVGRNESNGTVKLGVLFTNVPIGGSPRIDHPQPAGCEVD